MKAGKMKIVAAPTDEVSRAADEVRRVLVAVGRQVADDAEEWAAGAWVSDMSSFEDFRLEKGELLNVGRELGFPVYGGMLIADAALMLRPKN